MQCAGAYNQYTSGHDALLNACRYILPDDEVKSDSRWCWRVKTKRPHAQMLLGSVWVEDYNIWQMQSSDENTGKFK